ncbi:hypothetical protein NNJEOMEG_00559 [Fundidesulfovibrio magnetotacticus]|uniref:Flagellar basal-body/hook protein C-terminal domain-containing protein n=1 Tax=Fundidesulfovibrio magnetotacticus TaxID=2730080 RepID=A0A6V8LJ14_9BACT|nr:flagellar basal body rod C-terminal domain-containing protein [Fundidesulfovibrio magnetotacticus]GFK92732.1 hypothetical protein NNJEOMEG_00559 [Fundidesulfovibrio magnetotacticus]
MSIIPNLNAQALGALTHAAEDTARNLANLSTDGYQPVRTVISSGPATINAISEHSVAFGQTMAEPSFDIATDQKTQERAWVQPYQGGSVDVAREMVNLSSAERAFQANAVAVRTLEQTTGSVLDLMA